MHRQVSSGTRLGQPLTRWQIEIISPDDLKMLLVSIRITQVRLMAETQSQPECERGRDGDA